MNRTLTTAAVALSAIFALPAMAEPEAYVFDASHSQIVFSYDHLGYSTTYGMFGGFDGDIMFDQEDPSASSVTVSFPSTTMLTGWDALVDYCHTSMAHRATEQFRILYLDRKNVLIADEEQARGTVDHVPVYPREVVKRALELNASALILVHNHPSGDPTPSESDIDMTRRVQDAAEALGLTLHDHLIVGRERELSFRASGYL